MPPVGLYERTGGSAVREPQHSARQVDSNHVAALRLKPGEVTSHPTPRIQNIAAGTYQGDEPETEVSVEGR